MSTLGLLIIGLFLPLFPLSMVFNLLFRRLGHAAARLVLLVAWPLIGLSLLAALNVQVPDWVAAWALGTSAFYALRALAVREAGIWTAFMATSAWALLWVPVLAGEGEFTLGYAALGFSAPLMLMALLVAGLERRFGAAYACLNGRLAGSMPRYAGVLVAVLLAVIASPLFPGFFTLLDTMMTASLGVAAALAGIWLLWSWTGMRLLQGLVVGPPASEPMPDIGMAQTLGFAAALVGLAVVGVSYAGAML